MLVVNPEKRASCEEVSTKLDKICEEAELRAAYVVGKPGEYTRDETSLTFPNGLRGESQSRTWREDGMRLELELSGM
jgi:hypothetical protein